MIKAFAFLVPYLLTSAAYAAGCPTPTFNPTPAGKIEVQSAAPAAIDIAGISPGMSVAQVTELSKGLFGPDAQFDSIKRCIIVRAGGVTAVTPEFVNELGVSTGTDHGLDSIAHFTFSGPASGNQLIAMNRHVYLRGDKRPQKSDVVASLFKKYGEPSKVNGDMYDWYFSDGRLAKPKAWRVDSGMYQSPQIAALANMVSEYDVHISAMVFGSSDDHALSEGIEVTQWSNRQLSAARMDKTSIDDELTRLQRLPGAHQAVPNL